MSGAVIVGGVDTHSGARYTIFTESDAGRNCLLLEGAITLVQIELVRLRVVGQQDIGPAIIVVVENRDTQALRCGIAKVGLLRGILKLAVSKVVPETSGCSLI